LKFRTTAGYQQLLANKTHLKRGTLCASTLPDSSLHGPSSEALNLMLNPLRVHSFST
jgi:hypothetical protein